MASAEPKGDEYHTTIQGEDGSAVTLRLLDYQFPDISYGHDANWLRVMVEVISPAGSWTATDSCLLTIEIAQLADWLDSLGNGHTQEDALDFLEPELTFRFLESRDDILTLSIVFAYELRPRRLREARGDEEMQIDIHVPRSALLELSHSLRSQLRRLPPRGEFRQWPGIRLDAPQE